MQILDASETNKNEIPKFCGIPQIQNSIPKSRNTKCCAEIYNMCLLTLAANYQHFWSTY